MAYVISDLVLLPALNHAVINCAVFVINVVVAFLVYFVPWKCPSPKLVVAGEFLGPRDAYCVQFLSPNPPAY